MTALMSFLWEFSKTAFFTFIHLAALALWSAILYGFYLAVTDAFKKGSLAVTGWYVASMIALAVGPAIHVYIIWVMWWRLVVPEGF